MYEAVANRTIEIGTMCSLMYCRISILTVLVTESLFIVLMGAGVGLFPASFLQFFSISTLNWNSFAGLTFLFSLNLSIIISFLIFATALGLIGGLLVAVRAARLNIVNSLGEV